MTYNNYYEKIERFKVLYSKWLNIVIGILFVLLFVFLLSTPFYLHGNLVECRGELQSKELRKSISLGFRGGGHQDSYHVNGTPKIVLESDAYWFFRSLSAFVMHNNMKRVRPAQSGKSQGIIERFYGEYVPKTEYSQQGSTFYYYITKSASQEIQSPGRNLTINITPIFVSETNDNVGGLEYWISLVGWTLNSWINILGYYLILFITILLGTPEYVKIHRIYYYLLAGLFPLWLFI